MDLLSGWTIAVTADRRAAEQAALLQRRGADVVLAPMVTTTPRPEPDVRSATDELLARPVDTFVATSAPGLRSWIAMCWTWDLGDAVLAALGRTTLIARGAKTIGVLVGEGIDLPLSAPPSTLREVLDGPLAGDLTGRRIGVQLHGGDAEWFLRALRAAGAEVVPIPVYRVAATESARPGERLLTSATSGELDAITCTSAAAARSLAAVDGLVDELRRGGVVTGCVGPVTATAARAAGLPNVLESDPQRLGSMVRSLGEHLADRGHTLDVGGVELRHQGSRITVDGVEARLTPRERRVLDLMLATRGVVLSKERLAATAWDEPVDTHTVEVAVNRLRRKLGSAAGALETSNRRGYRIAV